MSAPVFLLIDGHSMAYRAFYGVPVEAMSTSTGQATNAVYGFLNTLLQQLKTHQPTYVAVAFDVGRHSFRTDIYPDYKGGRRETPEEFKGQVPLIKEALDTLGIRHLEVEEIEADDILATLSTQGAAAGMRVLVASGDRDAFQLVTQDVSVLYPKFRSSDLTVITPEEVEARYAVPPERYSDLAALVGEQSDNLPGVPGVGKVTAAKWITAYGDLNGILENADQIKGKAGGALREHADQVRLNRQLNQLRRDVPLPLTPEEMPLGALDREAMDQLFDALQFGQIRDRILKSGVWDPTPEPSASQDLRVVDVDDGDLAEFLASHPGEPWGVDVTGRIDRGDADAWTVAVAAADGTATSLDLETLGAVDSEALRTWLGDPDQPKAFHDAKTAWHELYGRNMPVRGTVFDTAVAAYLCFPDQRGYELGELTERLLGERLAEEETSGQGAFDLGGGHTNAARAAGIVHLIPPLTQELKDRHALELMETLELPLTPLLAGMEQVGIAVNLERLQAMSDELAGRAATAEADAYAAIGDKVNLASPKALQEVLFDRLNMPKTKKTKTGYSTNAASLAELFVKKPHPFLEHLLAHRDVTKIRQMVESLIAAVGDDGRIHTTFQQTVAATGRLSSADPNLQNIPVRSETGREVRHAFVVGPGYAELMTADYSQIEMRIMAHLSGDKELIEAFKSGEDLHATVAGRVFGVDPADVSGEQRSRIKAMSYGLAYGLSSYGLSRQLGITPGEAQALMDEYFRRFGGIRTYLDGVVVQARKDGYTQTIMGRRRYLPDLTSTNRQRREMAERMALNAPIQGSAADIIKVAMLRVAESFRLEELTSRVLLQVHDELVVEVSDGESPAVESILRREMGAAAKLSVPLVVSVGTGRSWKEAAH